MASSRLMRELSAFPWAGTLDLSLHLQGVMPLAMPEGVVPLG